MTVSEERDFSDLQRRCVVIEHSKDHFETAERDFPAANTTVASGAHLIVMGDPPSVKHLEEEASPAS